MKRFLLLTVYILLLYSTAVAKEPTPKGHWHQEWTEMDGERIPHIHILPVYVFSKGIDKRKYWRLVTAVKKVYPLAQTAKVMMADMEDELARLDTKKEQKEYVSEVYKAIIDEYTPVLKKMTRTQGRVLLRLIDRETEYTAYNIVHDFRGGFIAGFWQGVSKIFGQDLKAEYGENKEDDIIEQIVIYYEAGLL
ncbi:MAG: DUF4294 domain-containing protein [Rikenellaceae bacterium]